MSNRRNISVSMPNELAHTLTKQAHEAHMNKSEYIRELIKRDIDVDQKGAMA